MEPTQPIRIALALEYSLTQEGFRALLESNPDFMCVGEVGDHFDTVETIERFAPDILLLELNISNVERSKLVRQIQARDKPGVLVLLRRENEHFLLDALRLGISGCVLKNSSPAELFQAIRNVAAGGEHVPEGLKRKFFQTSLRTGGSGGSQSLTKREQMVLPVAAQGFSASQIAALFSISVRTAEAHRANILRKLGLKSQTELVRYAIREGIMSP